MKMKKFLGMTLLAAAASVSMMACSDDGKNDDGNKTTPTAIARDSVVGTSKVGVLTQIPDLQVEQQDTIDLSVLLSGDANLRATVSFSLPSQAGIMAVSAALEFSDLKVLSGEGEYGYSFTIADGQVININSSPVGTLGGAPDSDAMIGKEDGKRAIVFALEGTIQLSPDAQPLPITIVVADLVNFSDLIK
jgi:hypothetical protein